MATIGTFTKTANGDITGTVKTLTLNVKAKFVPTEGDSERGPDYRIFAGTTEFGAAWKKTARETGRDYLSVKLDDPSFPAPSTPAWSRTRAAKLTTSSGLAAPGTEAVYLRSPAATRGFGLLLIPALATFMINRARNNRRYSLLPEDVLNKRRTEPWTPPKLSRLKSWKTAASFVMATDTMRSSMRSMQQWMHAIVDT